MVRFGMPQYTPSKSEILPVYSISPPSENASWGILDNSESGDVTRHDFQERVRGLSRLNVNLLTFFAACRQALKSIPKENTNVFQHRMLDFL